MRPGGQVTGARPVLRVSVVLEQLNSPIPGGTGRFAEEMARALAEAAPERASVSSVVAWALDVHRAVVPGVAGPERLPLGRRALAEAWSRGLGPAPRRADVVYAPTLLMPPKRQAPIVVTIHDAVPWSHPETLTLRGVAWHRRMGKRAADEADLIAVPTQAVAVELSRQLDLGDRLRVVGGGWSLGEPLDAGARRRRRGLPADYLAFVGTVEPRKGLDVLLDALTELHLPLVVVGPPGWGGIDLESEARRRGLSGRVYSLGQVTDDDLAAVVSGAVALVVPSRAEGFGLPLLEAMALGTPVVASDAPALVEVGEGASVHSSVGDSAALARTVAEVAESQALREQMRTRGLEVAARRTWRREAEKLWGFYRDLVG